jgi:hypothetical protein
MLEGRDLQTRSEGPDMETCPSVPAISFPGAPYTCSTTLQKTVVDAFSIVNWLLDDFLIYSSLSNL